MQRLNPEKLIVTFLSGTDAHVLVLPRRYTLTHSDITGRLYLSIGNQYNVKQISGLYTRIMRDEILAEFIEEKNSLIFKLYCHVSGGLAPGHAKWRFNIFQSELPLVLEAIRYGDQAIFKENKELDSIPLNIYFYSKNQKFHKIENWGSMHNFS